MSCPDWPSLVAAREARGEDPPGWRASLDHLAGCADCRRRALAADPLLVFQRLPRAAVAPAEVAAMQQAVATLRRSRRVAAAATAGEGAPRRTLGDGRWRWSAAAAVLLAAALTLAPAGPGRPSAGGPAAPASPHLTTVRGQADPVLTSAFVEDLDLPDARVYQLAEEELSVVMIVDPSLDI